MSKNVIETAEDVRAGMPSASGLQRLVLCPGSWAAERLCKVDEPESEAAAMGTRLHAHMEAGTMPADATEAEAVTWCRETEEALAREFTEQAVVLFRELRLWDGCQRFSGQADVVYEWGGKALVLDYKFGRVEVDAAERNCQLYALALLVFDNYEQVEEVYAGILQPFVSRLRPTVARFRRADAKELRAWLYERLNAAMADNAPLIPGEAQCRYCKAAASCPALGLQCNKAAAMELNRWETWSVEDRRRAWDAARLAKKYVEAIERKVRADLEAGVELPGLELGQGKASFTVTDAGEAFSRLNAMLGISGEEFTRCCKVGVSDLDKLVHAKLAEQAPEGVKQTTRASREWLREALSDCAEVKYTAGTIKERKEGKR